MPTIKEIKAELKKNKIKGITGKKKAELLKMLGSGLSDLPEEAQKQVGSFLDNKEFGRLSTTSKAMKMDEEMTVRRLKAELKKIPQLKQGIAKLMMRATMLMRPLDSAYFEAVEEYIGYIDYILENPYLSPSLATSLRSSRQGLLDIMRRRRT